MLHDTKTHKVLRYVADCPAFTIAELQRDKKTVLGVTWNPDDIHRSGYPNTSRETTVVSVTRSACKTRS